MLFLPDAESELLATAKCSFAGKVEVAGSGVLGQITEPALGEASETLRIDFNAPEVGEGEYAQQYTETEAGLEYGLQASFNGGAFEAATLEAEAVASFEGEAGLVEGPGLVEGQLALEPPGGSFPASFSLAGEAEVSLRTAAGKFVNCTGEGEAQPLAGEGSFEDATSGTATIDLHNCHTTLGIKCTTAGQATGTIETEALPFRLVYLSDGEPGVLFLPDAESELLATTKCSFAGKVEVAGSGVLGQITEPALGEASETLTIDLNAPEVGEGEYAQQYTETEAGLEYGLQASFNGGAFEAATLEAEAVASFEGEGELTEE